jgi:phosphatidylserine/phosphatidylglycerophosphate/cardiolipin synthase-like enzyme
MRILIQVFLCGLLLLSSTEKVYAQTTSIGATDFGAPHEMETFVDVAECNHRLREDIREAGKPVHSKAEIWIATWSWSNDFYMDADKATLVEEIKTALISNPNLKVYVLLWDMPLAANFFLKLGWSHFNQSLAVEGWSNDLKRRFIVARESLLLKHPVSSAHQKFMLIQFGDDSAAYCFDFNFQNFFWDWNDHDVARRIACGFKLPPVHDTAIRFKGSAVADFRREFLFRWLKCKNSKHEPSATFTSLAGAKSIPYLRARFQHPGTKGGDIKEWYRSAIQNAHDYIYLENQFLDDQDISDDLIKAYFRGLSYPQPNIIVNLCSIAILEPKSQVNGTLRQVMRIRLSTAEQIELANGVVIRRTSPWEKVLVNKSATECSIRGLEFNGTIKLDQIKRLNGGIRFYTMLTAAAAPKVGFEPIYIHSKLGLIDNQLTIGSANQNRRSYGTDYEANVMVTDLNNTKEVESLRNRILSVLTASNVVSSTPFQKIEQTAELNTKMQFANPPTNPIGMVMHYPFCKNVRKHRH